MVTEKNDVGLSPTVSHVIEQFVAAMRADVEIPDDAIDRLEKLLRNEAAPKPEEINSALFERSPKG